MNNDKIQPDAPTHIGIAVARDTDRASEVLLVRCPDSGNWQRFSYIDEWDPTTMLNTYTEEKWLYRLTEVRDVNTNDLIKYWSDNLATANGILIDVKWRVCELEKSLAQARETLAITEDWIVRSHAKYKELYLKNEDGREG